MIFGLKKSWSKNITFASNKCHFCHRISVFSIKYRRATAPSFSLQCLLDGSSNLALGYFCFFENPSGTPFWPPEDPKHVTFFIEKSSFVIVNIYDLSGKNLTTLLNQQLSEGSHSIIWTGEDSRGKVLPSGFYVYEIITEKGSVTKKIAKIN